MEKMLRISLLADFYGELLTDKQKRLIDLYYNNDLSLAEIAQEFQVSRQAVFDILKRAEKSLEEYENKLRLVERFRNQQRKINETLNLVNELLIQISSSLTESQLIQINTIRIAINRLVRETNEE